MEKLFDYKFNLWKNWLKDNYKIGLERLSQITENTKRGDIVNAGYLSENNSHNYQNAIIVYIQPYLVSERANDDPQGIGKTMKCLNVIIRFNDGYTVRWL